MESSSPIWIFLVIAGIASLSLLFTWAKTRHAKINELIILTSRLIDLTSDIQRTADKTDQATRDILLNISRQTAMVADRLLALVERMTINGGRGNGTR